MQQDVKGTVTLVLGGVRSGKSRYAQQRADLGGRVTFIATAEARGDEEMLVKIARHRADRPGHWTTVEEPLHLETAIAEANCDVLVVDCLTLFAANLLEAHDEDLPRCLAAVDRLCDAIRASTCEMLLVSNEVGSGVVPAYASGRRFRDLLGEINQRIAGIAGSVVLLVAGLPLQLKTPTRTEVSQ